MINCVFENGNKASLRHAVVDVLVLKENKILLVKRAGGLLEGGLWGLVSGFVERDETLKSAVKREIFEETGYKVRNITLLKINDNPDRPHEDRQNISFVYSCEALKRKGKSDKESTSQKWLSFNQMPKDDEFAFDHYKNIEFYLKEKSEIKYPFR